MHQNLSDISAHSQRGVQQFNLNCVLPLLFIDSLLLCVVYSPLSQHDDIEIFAISFVDETRV